MESTLFSPSREAPLSVTQLNALLRAAIQKQLPGTLLVAGEISNLSRPSSGHLYFTLKDERSEIRCAMWRSSAAQLRFDPADGLAVLASATVDLYEPRGQVQLYVTRLEPRGIGALELAFRQLRDKLEKRGWFDAARKRPLPAFPRRIAVVTSLSGAAVRDIVQTIARRFPCVSLLLHPVRVQGDGAATEIAAAIAAINRSAEKLGGVDVLIVGRGGGSLEDLWAFNEEIVARAIVESHIPVVSAVGHETDVSISDLVADVRAATPTAAAELATPVRADLLDHLSRQTRRLVRGVRHGLEIAAARIERAAANEWLRDPRGCLGRTGQRLDEAAARLRSAMVQVFSNIRTRLHESEAGLIRARPEAVLARRRQRLEALRHRLFWVQGHLQLEAERGLTRLATDLAAQSPQHLAERHGVLLGQIGLRLARGIADRLGRERLRLDGLEARLSAASHESVLARGFSITRRARDGSVVRDPRLLRADERLSTTTAGGCFDSRVIDAVQRELFED